MHLEPISTLNAEKFLVMLWCSLIWTSLILVVYGPALLKFDLRRLQLTQMSCVRVIYGFWKRQPMSSSIKNWLVDCTKRYLLHSCTLCHNFLKSKGAVYFYNKIKFRTDVYNPMTPLDTNCIHLNIERLLLLVYDHEII